ncbi:unnamed protein product [Brassicogethes aeneus]|uniref:Cytochrome b5 heme-binding domain-containing protein n=1 Tax=Brassicogethes aeneus TaxID=1431903 RepID=A0A9P0BBE6_BRAAE|nr:unnamed protein product [Brassicogethes aeneus]
MAEKSEVSGGILTNLVSEVVQSPMNLALVVLIVVLVYKILKNRQTSNAEAAPQEVLPPKMKKQDFTVAELKKYDGNQEDGRVLVAVNGNVYDVTKGKKFYGPGGPYAAFGGKDASRGLATFQVSAKEEEYDDLSDLNSFEMESVREWEMQFKEKYELVGKLLKPGEAHNSYSDEEDEPTNAGDQKSKDE